MLLDLIAARRGRFWLPAVLAALAVPAAWGRCEGSAVRVSVFVAPSPSRTAGGARPHVRLHATRESSAGAAREPAREWALDGPGQVVVELMRDAPWRLAVEAPGFWAPEALLQPGDDAEVAFRLLPTGRIAGHVVTASREIRPSSLTARFRGSPGGQGLGVAVGSIACPLDGERWKCAVPAGVLDVRLSAAGFVPRYFWDVAVRPRQRSDLGAYELLRGASLIGRVEVEDSAPGGEAPVVELAASPLAASAASRAAAGGLAPRTLTARPGPRGFFQFAGIPAGGYVVTARLAGFAAAAAPLTALRGSEETELPGPIVLARPLTLEVRLQPALDPFGQPWRCELLSAPPTLLPGVVERVGEGMTDAAGVFKREELAPGRFLLFVRDMTRSEWVREWIEIAPGKTVHEFKVDLVAVEGRISERGKPLQATLWLAAPQGSPRIRFDSDARGAFAGSLPGEGEWLVDLDLPGGGVEALPQVEVRRGPGVAPARLEIRVPATRLTLAISDEQGRPVPGAEVIALGTPEERRRKAQLRADERGRVVLRGLSPGVVRLYAHHRDAASDWVAHTLVEDVDAPPLSLVLRQRIHLRGYVVASEGPVAGALVTVFPEAATVDAWQGRGVSDADGQFDVALDRSFAGGSLAVFAPGFAARMLRVQPPGASPPALEIAVDQDGGDLLVDVRGLDRTGLARARLAHNGARLPLTSFLAAGRAAGGRGDWLNLSLMEPGQYGFCPEGEGSPAACTSGWLGAGGRLELGKGRQGGAAQAQARPGDPR